MVAGADEDIALEESTVIRPSMWDGTSEEGTLEDGTLKDI